MSSLIIAIIFAALASGDAPHDVQALKALVTIFNANRESLAATGNIQFHHMDGYIKESLTLEEFQKAFRGKWERKSQSDGYYIYKGNKRRYENVFSVDEMVSRRKKTGPSSWVSPISSYRLLTDGETTLVANMDVGPDDTTLVHSPNLRHGLAFFFMYSDAIPMNLGNPDPPLVDLGTALKHILDLKNSPGSWELDMDARFEGHSVALLNIKFGETKKHARLTFWIDASRGGIPLQVRYFEPIPDDNRSVLIQINNDDLRKLERGWVPFRWSIAEGYLDASGNVLGTIVRETVITEAQFSDAPPDSVFQLTFPQPVGLSDPDRMLGFGSRKTWTLQDFSPQAASRARSIQLSANSSNPPMQQAGTSVWGSYLLVIFGISLLGIAIWQIVRRRSDAAGAV